VKEKVRRKVFCCSLKKKETTIASAGEKKENGITRKTRASKKKKRTRGALQKTKAKPSTEEARGPEKGRQKPEIAEDQYFGPSERGKKEVRTFFEKLDSGGRKEKD